jgi:hypothetical protein
MRRPALPRAPGELPTGGDETTGPPPEPEVLVLMEDVVFYDGYAGTVDEPVPEGVIRHSNAARDPVHRRALAAIQSTLKIGVDRRGPLR